MFNILIIFIQLCLVPGTTLGRDTKVKATWMHSSLSVETEQHRHREQMQQKRKC